MIPGSGRSPGEGNGNRLQYSCLENFMEFTGSRRFRHNRARTAHPAEVNTAGLTRALQAPEGKGRAVSGRRLARPGLNTYLPPVVVVSLGFLGNDASPEPQVSSDVQGPQALLVPESYTDGLQSLPLTGNEDKSVESAPRFLAPQRVWDADIKCRRRRGSVWDKR